MTLKLKTTNFSSIYECPFDKQELKYFVGYKNCEKKLDFMHISFTEEYI